MHLHQIWFPLRFERTPLPLMLKVLRLQILGQSFGCDSFDFLIIAKNPHGGGFGGQF